MLLFNPPFFHTLNLHLSPLSLLLSEKATESIFSQLLLALWKHECKRVIADRFTKPEDVEWFDQALATLVGEEMGDEHKCMVDLGADRYFVDFLRDAPEATGAHQPNVKTRLL